jgi:hypothetical protein
MVDTYDRPPLFTGCSRDPFGGIVLAPGLEEPHMYRLRSSRGAAQAFADYDVSASQTVLAPPLWRWTENSHIEGEVMPQVPRSAMPPDLPPTLGSAQLRGS